MNYLHVIDNNTEMYIPKESIIFIGYVFKRNSFDLGFNFGIKKKFYFNEEEKEFFEKVFYKKFMEWLNSDDKNNFQISTYNVNDEDYISFPISFN